MAKSKSSSTKTSKKRSSVDIFVQSVRDELDGIVTREKVIRIFAVLKRKNTILFAKSKEVAEKAKNHLRGIREVFKEYDDHGYNHTERIIECIVDILGNELEELSSYEVFSIILSAYLHDCGMAVSASEIKVMELAENKDFDGFELDDEKAYALINENKNYIYDEGNDNFENKTQKWLFCPETEQQLIKYYENLLVEYHKYRNSKIKFITKTNGAIEETCSYENSNKELRTVFLRMTHHSRIYDYIINSTVFDNCDYQSRLEKVIAEICKGHGEDKGYIIDLEKECSFGNENCNIQFLAMLLRLGDIMDFRKERASKTEHALYHFISQNSSQHWEIKFNCDITPSIKEHQACFQADCETPKDYYDLMGYIDWIDKELVFFNDLLHEWRTVDNRYDIELKKSVNRKQIKTKGFTPASARISLDQSKLLDLLMGMQLYKRKYACLRELYQNSMDACRFQNSLSEQKSTIEFGLDYEDGKKYIYCLDNGCGMTKSIIENYLIKIGHSYYRSTEFYSRHNENDFTPTSQFGIGILSCFMISNKLLITTKALDDKFISCSIELGKDYISCGDERFYDYFYYSAPVRKDKEKIKATGTLIKIFLNDDVAKDLNDHYFADMISFLTCGVEFRRMHPSLEEQWSMWENNIYNILNEYILVTPEDITLKIKLNGGRKTKEILNKPLIMGANCEDEFKITDSNISIINKNFSRLNLGQVTQLDVIDYIKMKVIIAERDGIQYHVAQRFLSPNYGITDFDLIKQLSMPVHRINGFCVDGIKVDMAKPNSSYINQMAKLGLVNFVGNNRPQLTVDRNSIIEENFSKYDDIAKGLLVDIINKVIKNSIEFINENRIEDKSTYYFLVWYRLMNRFIAFPEILISAIFNYEDSNGINIYSCMENCLNHLGGKLSGALQCFKSVLERINQLMISFISEDNDEINCMKRIIEIINDGVDRSFTGRYTFLTAFLSEKKNLYLIKNKVGRVFVKFDSIITKEELSSLVMRSNERLVKIAVPRIETEIS